MVCPNCGANNDSTAAFCFNCGERLEQAPAPVGSPTIRIPPGDSAGSPTIRIPPSENPFPPPSVAPSPPQANPYSTQPFDTPAASPPPFGVPTSQPPAMPYSTSPFGAPAVVPNSTAAIISLVFGIVSWFVLPLIGAIVAVVAGHMARNEIRRSNGTVGGSGMATAGLILGYAHLALVLIGGCLFLVFVVGIGLSANH